ncbi:YpoC family protein [Jeotgalibacillus terrae]|uniref:YpoC family protein n=1 Tax=Jeotgalibacillus terrae TaxID=587735 RepID=A0ABW5ZLI5_9BACL|nr:hypothetical protein [Jeotgalibacillus terrae]MBM7577401.1 hypothetical protein [Jeotgalibacillus terrae]
MKIIVPEQYKHPLFYRESADVEINETCLFEHHFGPDLFYLNQQEKPWEEIERWTKLIKLEWETLSAEMRPLFEGHADQTYDSMVKGLSLFFTLLYWSNEQHISVSSWEEDLKKFEVSIMNAHERISFVMKRPAVYFSYIQLDEMFRELNKTSAKFHAMRKRKRG